MAVAALWSFSAPAGAITKYVYDFQWYSGASQPWVYEAASMLALEVYEDPSTPENDVYFTMRNNIDTELGQGSSIVFTQIDTGTADPDMFDDLTIWDHSPGVRYFLKMVGDPKTYTLIDIAASRIAWAGDYAPQKEKDSSPKTDGINPYQYITFRAILKNGMTFADVIAALDAGLVTNYVNGPYDQWPQDKKEDYRAAAPAGLRFSYLVHSIVPNSWHTDGHGLFVTNSLVAVTQNEAPVIESLSAEPASLLDTQNSLLSVVATDPDAGPQPLGYSWSIVAGGGTLDDPTSATPVYTPAPLTGSETVVIWVKVSDGEIVTRGELTLEVSGNEPPSIVRLVAEPRVLMDNQTSTLSVEAVDPDNRPQSLSYSWSIVSGGGALDDAASENPLYTPPDVSAEETVTLRVAVSDGDAVVEKEITLQVSDAGNNLPPTIESLSAQPETLLDTGTSILSVVASDPDDGPQPLSYRWTIVSGGGELDDPASPAPVYTPADLGGLEPVAVKLRVEVSDGEVSVSRDLAIQVSNAEAPPPGAVLLFDDFSGDLADSHWKVWENGTKTAPSDWRMRFGELVQRSNIWGGDDKAAGLPKPGTYLLYEPGTHWVDYRATFTMRSADDDALGIMFRYMDDDNYYRFSWDAQRSYRRLLKKENGRFEMLAFDAVPYEKNRTYQVEIVARGSRLEVWIDGEMIFQVEDDSFYRGSIAFYSWYNMGAFFDDLLVADLGDESSSVSCLVEPMVLPASGIYEGSGNTLLFSTVAIEAADGSRLTVEAPHHLIFEAPEFRIPQGSSLRVAKGAGLRISARMVNCSR